MDCCLLKFVPVTRPRREDAECKSSRGLGSKRHVEFSGVAAASC